MSAILKFAKIVVWELIDCDWLPTDLQKWFTKHGCPLMQTSVTKTGIGVMIVIPVDPKTQKAVEEKVAEVAALLVKEGIAKGGIRASGRAKK